jgi:hypothetical protein
VDVRLDDVVLRSLEKEPDRRYQHASEVKTDVEYISRSGVTGAAGVAVANGAGQPPQPAIQPRAGLPAAEELAAARAEVRGPAIGLLVTGIIHCTASAVILLGGLATFGFRFAAVESSHQQLSGPYDSISTSSGRSEGGLPDPIPLAPQFESHSADVPASPGSSPTGWTMGAAGPVLTEPFARGILRLQPAEIEKANAGIQKVYQEFLAVEQQHIEQHTDEAGHVVVTISPFPAQVEKLENRLWSELDPLLDPDRQSIARLNLKLDQREIYPGVTMSDIVAPGMFGWGKGSARIEIWRIGAWFHWNVHSRGYTDSSRGPQLPAAYRRFWNEPVEAPADLPEANTQPEGKE